jgi:hypothetical protein
MVFYAMFSGYQMNPHWQTVNPRNLPDAPLYGFNPGRCSNLNCFFVEMNCHLDHLSAYQRFWLTDSLQLDLWIIKQQL